MKKLIAVFLCAVLMLSACGKPETKVSSDAEVEEVAEEPVSEFYEMATNSNRPIALMIDNDSEDSRPQIGLEDAYLIYEIIVEGGASRIMALFKNYDIDKVGPIRSSRHYFLDYALENGAIYAHAGWSPKAQKDISSLGVNNINGVGADGSVYWRDNTYDSSWHNLYTSVAKLSEYAEDTKGYKMEAKEGPISFANGEITPDGDECTSVAFSYSDMYSVSYSYDAETKLYSRSINSKPHVSQTGETFTASNIIIYNVPNHNLNDGENKGRQDLVNIGSGEGWFISAGKAEKINWEKNARDKQTIYTKADGSALEVNPGITYIQIIPEGRNINIQ